MNHKQPAQRDLAASCVEVHAEDGNDPKRFFRVGRRQKKPNRKTLQLCSQVADTLNLALTGESGDDVLSELQVISVVPAPNTCQLLVVLAPTLVGGPDEQLVIAALAEASVRLRAEVANAITRRRAPKLLFQFVNCPLTRI
jgi:ribosome-binding factor A